jgi:hypothetical protein
MSVLDDDIADLQQAARELQDNDPQLQKLQEQMTRKAHGRRASAKVISAPQAGMVERITVVLPLSLSVRLALCVPLCCQVAALHLLCRSGHTAPAGHPSQCACGDPQLLG